MARRIPPIEVNDPWMHPILTLSLLVAWIAASIAIFATLCSSCHPKPAADASGAPSTPPSNDSVNKTETSAPAAATIETENQQEEEGEEAKITELDAPIHGPIGPTALPASVSKRKLSMSMSMGIPDGLNKIKTIKKERHHGKGGEESLWKKTIILGEKCRLPNDEEDDDEDVDANKTRRASPRSLPATSRTTSFARAEVVP